VAAPAFAFDGVVRLTRFGIGYLFFTLLVGFAALNTGNNSLYIGLAYMLAGLLVSGVASKGGLHHLQIELGGVDEAWAGKPADAVIRVRNRSRIWTVRDVVIVSEHLDEPVLVPIVARNASIDLPARFLFSRRGAVKLQRLDLYTRFPFGLILKKRRVRIDGEVVVFPRLLEEGQQRLSAEAVAKDAIPRPRQGTGQDIFAFRDYVRGDSLRHVHWKKSASLGRWIMKQLQEEAGISLAVAIDPVKPEWADDESFETMISEAATLLWNGIRSGAEVTLILPSERISGAGDRVRGAIFRALALLQAETGGDLPVVPHGAVLFSLRSEHATKTA
jgi:uncharacterized protein (DUF58 family)